MPWGTLLHPRGCAAPSQPPSRGGRAPSCQHWLKSGIFLPGLCGPLPLKRAAGSSENWPSLLGEQSQQFFSLTLFIASFRFQIWPNFLPGAAMALSREMKGHDLSSRSPPWDQLLPQGCCTFAHSPGWLQGSLARGRGELLAGVGYSQLQGRGRVQLGAESPREQPELSTKRCQCRQEQLRA